MSELTPKQQRFCDEYLVDMNATQAAIRCGYSPKTANVQGSRLLTYANIAAYIKEKQKTAAERLGITQERILLEQSRIGFFDIRKLYDDNGRLKNIQDLDDDTAAAISQIEVLREQSVSREETDDDSGEVVNLSQSIATIKVKPVDKAKALDAMAKHLGMYVEKHEVKHEMTLAQLVEMSMRVADPLEENKDGKDSSEA